MSNHLTLRSRLVLCLLAVCAAVQTATSQSPEMAVGPAGSSRRAEAVLTAIRQRLPYVPGELLVKFRPGATLAQQRSALRVLRSNAVADQGEWIGETLHLTNLAEDDPLAAALVLRRQGEVLFAEPNYIARRHGTPNDAGYASQWNLDLINMPRAWDINTGAGEGVTVAVVDSGLTTIDGTFGFRIWTGSTFSTFSVPFLKAADFDHSRVRAGAEFTQTGPWFSPSGQQILFDAGLHGTHVAGTVVQQTNNQVGFAGVANGATLIPVKVCSAPWDFQLWAGRLGLTGFATEDDDACFISDVARGIRYAADNGANVINLSIGINIPTQTVLDAIQYAVQKGAFVSVSAGNEGFVGNQPSYPAANAPEVNGLVAVGSVTRSSQRALYSNTGSYLELVAPGGSGFGAASENIFQMIPHPEDLSLSRLAPAFNRYIGAAAAGTSMAAPHASGLAALLYSHGIKNPAAIEAAMKRFARDLGPAGRDNEYGYGLIDARAALLGLGLPR